MSPATGLPGKVQILSDAEALAASAADWVVAAAAASGPEFHIALAGGSTPKRLYELLAGRPSSDAIDWSRWHVWFGDERACSPADFRANFAMARHALLDRVHVPIDNIHRMEAESPDLDGAAAAYSSLLALTVPSAPGGAPR